MPQWAKAGVVLIGAAVAAAIVLPLFSGVRERGPSPDSRCISNMHLLTVALSMYAADYDGAPEPQVWCDRLKEYVGDDALQCPRARGLRSAYAFNAGAAGVGRRVLGGPQAAQLTTIFESDRGWNAHGGRELRPREPRHLGGDVYGFLNGHSDWIKRGDPEARIDWAAPTREGAGRQSRRPPKSG